MTSVSIIVPVYADWPSLKDCIESLKKFVDTSRHTIILVNDCGPEADMMETNIKANIKDRVNFNYYRNSKNLGFLQTCNRAVKELDKTKNEVLLLNSDTKVTKGFLDELISILENDPKIAAVSPRSNNATINTVPLSAAPKKGIEPAKSYQIFLKLKDKLPRYSEVPTAHGFCMLIRRSLIKKYGLFDEVFGKGYGEEVDFCQRVIAQGFKCVMANRAFVYHLEARSFSLEAKAKMLETNNQILRRRYPGYQQLVRDYINQAEQQEGQILYPHGRPIKKLKKIVSIQLRKVKPR